MEMLEKGMGGVVRKGPHPSLLSQHGPAVGTGDSGAGARLAMLLPRPGRELPGAPVPGARAGPAAGERPGLVPLCSHGGGNG